MATCAFAIGLLKAAALAAGTSKSPLSYFQDLRVEHAIHLLQTSSASVEQIAARVGYADGVTLRTLLMRKAGRSVRELRRLSRLC